MRDQCGSTREGVSFRDLSCAAENIGLRTMCVKVTLQGLQNKATLPAIIHWKKSHFVVVYKISKNKVYVSDPAKGLITYTLQEFKASWITEEGKGLALLLEPQADFKYREPGESSNKTSQFSRLWEYFSPYKKAFAVLFSVMVVVTLLQTLLPFISRAIIDIGIHTNDIDFINLILIANIVIVISMTLSNVVRSWVMMHITSRLNIVLISDYLIKLMRLPIAFFENKMLGDILQRANDHERIRSFLMNNSVNVLFSSVTFIIFSVILYIFNPKIFFVFVAGGALYITWILSFLKLRKKLDWEYYDLISKNQSFWVETMSAIQDIKINNYEKPKRWKWERIQARIYKVNLKLMNVNNFQTSGALFIDGLKNALITFVCAKGVIAGEITFGIMISTQFIIGMMNGPLSQFISFVVAAQAAKISFLRLNEINQLKDEDAGIVSVNVDLLPERGLILKNVSFQYSTNAPLILKNTNLTIPHGKVTAIVGDSGSGKSTLLKLLLRIYQPSSGEILIGDMNLNTINLKQWREQCGVVMQDGKIFNDTILNNIVLDDENVNYPELKRVLDISNISSEIEQMPLGYQTVVGEMGRGLSGGQKQRILIARALYKDPSYLFFDEATNSLDTINERKIVESMDTIFEGKTVLVIAHRLSTIIRAHQIVVLRLGTIVEIGTHTELLKKRGYYYQLAQSQFTGEIQNSMPQSDKSNGRFSDLFQ